MRTVERRIKYEGRGTQFSFYNLADIHAGSTRCAEKKLRKMIATIKDDPHAYWGLGGDWGEFINRHDPRHKESELSRWLHGVDDIAAEQEQWLFEILGPIAGKCLWVNAGNHERSIFQATERNVYSNMVIFLKQTGGFTDQQIGIGYQGFVRVRMERPGHTNTIIIMAQHGFGGGRLKGGDVLNSARIFGYYGCDMFFTGHRHKAHVIPHTVTIPAGQGSRDILKYATMTGTFRGNTVKQDEMDPGSYEQSKAYFPSDVTGTCIRYDPDTREMTATVFPY